MVADTIPELEAVEIDVDPAETTLEKLLNLAEAHKTGNIVMRGEMEDGTVQWGIVVVCNINAGKLMQRLQDALDECVADELAKTAN